jgi:hypothetical protein
VDRIVRAPLLGRLMLAAIVVALAVGAGLPAPVNAETAPLASIPAWDGGVNLYRNGAFATQGTWEWCTAAGVQIVRNIVHGQPVKNAGALANPECLALYRDLEVLRS